MARKKSAAKKAKEAEIKAETQVDVPEIEKDNEPTVDEFSGSGEELSSEDEDEFGELLTENVEGNIQKVLQAIQLKSKDLFDPKIRFFEESNETAVNHSSKKDKPLYLKDYHRQTLLSGQYKDDDGEDNAYGTVDGEKPFVVVEREERNQLLDDIKNAFGDQEEGLDDDMLQIKEHPLEVPTKLAPLPDPEKDSGEFLKAFLDNQAWIPKKEDKVINLDDIDQGDDQEFDEAVEDFEKAYNFRYEDPNSAEIVSYARTQATLRRGKTNARKRAREKKQAAADQEREETEKALQQKKTQKVNKVMDRLAKIKEAVGDEIDDNMIEKVFGDSLLNDDFDDADWDEKMAQVFNEQYYGEEVTKPVWSDDGEEMEAGNGEDAEDVEAEIDEDTEMSEEPPKKKSKKEKLQEKKKSKKEKSSLKEKAAQIVEANTTKLLDEVEEERGRGKTQGFEKFKYRDVSPESFGLSTREIFLADDSELNKYFSIKKFAPYKPKELALKEKRKYAKKKHLQQWRKEVFHDKNGPTKQAQEKDDEIWIPVTEEEEKGNRRETHNRKEMKRRKERKEKKDKKPRSTKS